MKYNKPPKYATRIELVSKIALQQGLTSKQDKCAGCNHRPTGQCKFSEINSSPSVDRGCY